MLQQHLPLAVLKRTCRRTIFIKKYKVATAPTACGIETVATLVASAASLQPVATAPTACGIET